MIDRIVVLVQVVAMLLSTPSCGPVHAADTERQVRIYQATERYAALANVVVRVSFSDSAPVINGVPSAGWVNCPQNNPPVIDFNASWLESVDEAGVVYMEAVAAHEVCHVHYGEHLWPCRAADEWRATVCGSNLQTCGRVYCP